MLAIINVAGVVATVIAAWAAVVALRAIDRDRRIVFELQELRAIWVAVSADNTILGSRVREPVLLSLSLLPGDLLPLTRKVFTTPHGVGLWVTVGGSQPTPETHGVDRAPQLLSQGGLMPDGTTSVGDAVRAEVHAAIEERVRPESAKVRAAWLRLRR